LFLGTSRFYYAVSPRIFDNITRENGVLALGVVHWLNARGTFANWWRRGPDQAFAAAYGCTAAIVLLFVPPHYTPFIYFQF